MPSSPILEQVFLEVAKKFKADTNAIKNELYPAIQRVLDSSKGKNDYKKCVANFIEKRAESLYDTIPVSRILFTKDDVNDLFKSIGLNEGTAAEVISHTYYGNEPNFSPLAAKDPFTITMMNIVRYFIMKNMTKEAELAITHLCFSGKFYPSLHYRSYPTTPPIRHVMEYTVNNVLSTKFDLVAERSVIGSVRKIGITWMNTYKNRFKSFTDEDVVYMIAQLYSRIGSFMKNIASAYYETYKDKDDLYIAYSGDSLDDDDYHLADSDSLKISRTTEKAVNYIVNNGVDYSICKNCSDENITTNEIKSIIESILNAKENIPLVKELISLMIVTYFQQAKPNERDVTHVAFITYCMAAKPNAKQKEIVKQKEIIEKLLVENSTAYIRRRSRLATKNSYERAIRMYFGLSIHNANR